MRKKKLLFMEDLLQFFRENNLTKFSSSDSGYKLCVQVPATFEVEDEIDDDHRGMMRLKFRIFHLDVNRNGSFVSKKAAKAAMPTIKNRPVMAYIHQRDDGEWDFEAHNMTVETDEDGNSYYEYQEKQVGSFDESEPFFEYDEELDKTFVCAYAYISEDYTRACDIIRRKGGTKNSVELSIEELAYNAKEGYLDLQKFYVSASTLLGSYDDGTEVGEGMLGSRADIADFSESNNSVLSNREELINEVATAVIKRLSDKEADFSAESKTTRKEENPVDKKNVKVEFDTTEADKVDTEKVKMGEAEVETTEEETPVIETEASEDEADEKVTDTPEVVDDFADGDESTDDEGGDEPADEPVEPTDDHQSTSAIEDEDSTGTRVENSLEYSVTIDGIKREFAISLADKINAVTTLVNDTYAENDNCWYYCDVYEDDGKYCVMHDFWNDKHFKQEFSVKKDIYSLKGDRVQVYAQYLTADQIAQLDKMKSDFSAIESELNEYKSKELHSAREAVLASEDYSVMADFDEFKELKANMDNYSVEELTNKADLIYAKFMKSNYSNFATNTSKKRSVVFMTSGSNNEEEKLPYGGLFKNFKNKNR